MNFRVPISPPSIPKISSDFKRPNWSIMIPAYNCIKYLPDALKSILQQDFGNDTPQIEVIDDGSTDGDLSGIVAEIGEGKIQYYRQENNQGSLRTFQLCLTRAKGIYVHLLHGDDVVEPGFYKEVMSLFTAYPEVGAVFTQHAYIDTNGKVLELKAVHLLEHPGIVKDFLAQIAKRQLIQPPAIAVKREVYERIGSFYGAEYGEDWEMWSRIAANYQMAHSPRVLAHYRVGTLSGISHKSFETGQNIVDMIKVIDIIQSYLPQSIRKHHQTKAREYYAIYAIKVANALITTNPRVALIQIKGALSMSKSIKTFMWIGRFYLLYLLGLKALKEKWANKSVH